MAKHMDTILVDKTLSKETERNLAAMTSRVPQESIVTKNNAGSWIEIVISTTSIVSHSLHILPQEQPLVFFPIFRCLMPWLTYLGFRINQIDAVLVDGDEEKLREILFCCLLERKNNTKKIITGEKTHTRHCSTMSNSTGRLES